MGCCANTFRREPTWHAMAGRRFKRSLMHSTTDPVKCSAGEHQRKCLAINYARDHGTVLRRHVESALRSGVRAVDGVLDRMAGARPQRCGLTEMAASHRARFDGARLTQA